MTMIMSFIVSAWFVENYMTFIREYLTINTFVDLKIRLMILNKYVRELDQSNVCICR